LAQLFRPPEKIRIQQASESKPLLLRGDNDAIDIREFFKPAVEPEKVAAIKSPFCSKQQGGAGCNERRHARGRYHPIEFLKSLASSRGRWRC
jgi:hypothetical protein